VETADCTPPPHQPQELNPFERSREWYEFLFYSGIRGMAFDFQAGYRRARERSGAEAMMVYLQNYERQKTGHSSNLPDAR
jgi:hypothetical protein